MKFVQCKKIHQFLHLTSQIFKVSCNHSFISCRSMNRTSCLSFSRHLQVMNSIESIAEKLEVTYCTQICLGTLSPSAVLPLYNRPDFAADPLLDGWHGARQCGTSPDLSRLSVTRVQYMETGEGCIAEHPRPPTVLPRGPLH